MILNSSIFYSFSCKTVALRQAYYLNSRFEIFYLPTRTTYLGHVKASDNELVVDSFPINQSFRVGRFLLIPSDPLSIESIYHNLGLPAFIFIDWLIRLKTIFMFFYLPLQYPWWHHYLIIFLNQPRLNHPLYSTKKLCTRKTFLSESLNQLNWSRSNCQTNFKNKNHKMASLKIK